LLGQALLLENLLVLAGLHPRLRLGQFLVDVGLADLDLFVARVLIDQLRLNQLAEHLFCGGARLQLVVEIGAADGLTVDRRDVAPAAAIVASGERDAERGRAERGYGAKYTGHRISVGRWDVKERRPLCLRRPAPDSGRAIPLLRATPAGARRE